MVSIHNGDCIPFSISMSRRHCLLYLYLRYVVDVQPGQNGNIYDDTVLSLINAIVILKLPVSQSLQFYRLGGF